MSIKYVDIKEFREFGFLQELNRLFLHPRGMALEAIINDDGTETLGGIWDARGDEEGFVFCEIDKDTVCRVEEFTTKIFKSREEKLGYIIQMENFKEIE